MERGEEPMMEEEGREISDIAPRAVDWALERNEVGTKVFFTGTKLDLPHNSLFFSPLALPPISSPALALIPQVYHLGVVHLLGL